jgi:hypothetical protein
MLGRAIAPELAGCTGVRSWKSPWMVDTDVNGVCCKGLDSPLTSADHVGRLEEEDWGDGQAERLGGLEVNQQLELHRLLDRQIGRLGAFQDFVHVGRGGWCTCATSKANEIFESPLPERRVSDTRPGNTHTFLTQREDTSAR